MNYLVDFLQNKLAIVPLLSWIVAQILKIFTHAIVNKKFEIQRLWSDGGMPSGHTATVTSLATATALIYGFGSFEFAVTGVLACIVMRDAMGVRLEMSKHAKQLNLMAEILSTNSTWSNEKKLKELLGHTPLQVFGGFVLGIVMAFIIVG